MAIADKHAFVNSLLTGCQFDLPKLVASRTDGSNLCVEFDLRPEIKCIGVKLVILTHLLLAGKIGVIRRHGEIGEFGGFFRGNYVCSAVCAVVPVAADLVVGLDLFVDYSCVIERFGVR